MAQIVKNHTFQEKFKNSVTQSFADLGPKSRAVLSAAPIRTHDAADDSRSRRVIPTQEVIDNLASRIEAAYRLRSPRWSGGCSTARVWDRAALYLWHAHVEAPESVPLDAELYVASQDIAVRFANPWLDLARPEAIRRYRCRIDLIVRRLRAELKKEIGRAERAIRQGDALQKILRPRSGRLSPLGCYITALRADRHDLAVRFRRTAALQHQACPLYRLASAAFIPADCYLFDRFPLAPLARPALTGMLAPTLN